MGQGSPLAPTLSRYADFFALFGDFRGYVSFFLLEDLVTDDGSVKFFMPFDDFRPPSVPKDVDTYKEYRRRSIEFIEARNRRIKQLDIWVREDIRDCQVNGLSSVDESVVQLAYVRAPHHVDSTPTNKNGRRPRCVATPARVTGWS